MKLSEPDVLKTFSTPFDNPLVPKFPIRFRNTEILTIRYRTDPACIERSSRNLWSASAIG